jgi:hypothetical protein
MLHEIPVTGTYPPGALGGSKGSAWWGIEHGAWSIEHREDCRFKELHAHVNYWLLTTGYLIFLPLTA